LGSFDGVRAKEFTGKSAEIFADGGRLVKTALFSLKERELVGGSELLV